MESKEEIKINNLGCGLLQANFHEQPWSDWPEKKTDEVLAELKNGIIKLAQHLNLEVVDEEGYLI